MPGVSREKLVFNLSGVNENSFHRYILQWPILVYLFEHSAK